MVETENVDENDEYLSDKNTVPQVMSRNTSYSQLA